MLAQNEDVWSKLLPQQANIRYVPPRLVVFSGVDRSGCGTAQAAMGPFYCPPDRKVDNDQSFFDEIKRKTEEKGLTLVPLKVYFKDGRAKLELGLAKGKKNYDKRHALAERDAQRDVQRALRGRGD